MKKIVTLEIFFDEDKKMMQAQLNHTCGSLEVALQVIQEFVDKKSRRKEKPKDA